MLLSRFGLLILLFTLLSACDQKPAPKKPGEQGYQRPNFLFITSDDQSWIHTSFAGYPFVSTPNFDKIASQGVYFNNAFAAAPSCASSRTSILTGFYPWRTKSGAVLGGQWPEDIPSYQNILKENGYYVGYTGKGWGPGHINKRSFHPEGKYYFSVLHKNYFWQPEPPHPLASSLSLFLTHRPKDQPFSFWIGSTDPHRPFAKGNIDRFKNAKPETFLPGFLPNTTPVQEDLAAYLEMIERFDKDLGEIIQALKANDAFDNTIIVVTSDNGMSFGRAKTQNYDYGLKIPLAIYWNEVTKGKQRVDDMVGLYDIAPTFLQAAEVPIPADMNGKSLVDILYSNRSGQVEADRTAIFTAVERHSFDARPQHVGYSSRAIHTKDYVLIHNNFPDRWPSGNNFTEAEPQLLVDRSTGLHLEPYFSWATAKRPAEELYYLPSDPYELHNLVEQADLQPVHKALAEKLNSTLKQTEDPVFLTGKDVFSNYPYTIQ